MEGEGEKGWRVNREGVRWWRVIMRELEGECERGWKVKVREAGE